MLHIAQWLQQLKSKAWVKQGQLEEAVGGTTEFLFGLFGPGGTGKTAVLVVAAALIEYHYCPRRYTPVLEEATPEPL